MQIKVRSSNWVFLDLEVKFQVGDKVSLPTSISDLVIWKQGIFDNFEWGYLPVFKLYLREILFLKFKVQNCIHDFLITCKASYYFLSPKDYILLLIGLTLSYNQKVI